MLVASLGTPSAPAFADRRNFTGAQAAFGKAVKLNQRDAGLCASYALVCMILGEMNSAITALHEVPQTNTPNIPHYQFLFFFGW
jgi:hypothetical protein